MATGNLTRKRGRRFATVAQKPGWARQWFDILRQTSVLTRLGMCALAAVALLFITRGWAPTRSFFLGQIPTRPVIARTTFSQVDPDKTRDARKRERSLALAVYVNDPAEIEQLWARLKNDVEIIIGAQSLANVDPTVWAPFETPPSDTATQDPEQLFGLLQEQLKQEGAREAFQLALDDTLRKIRPTGLIDALPPDREMNFQLIAIRPRSTDTVAPTRDVAVEDVLIDRVAAKIESDLRAKMPTPELASAAYRWLKGQLPVTLRLDEEATRQAQDAAERAVEPVLRTFAPNPTPDNVLAQAGAPIDAAAMERLELEYQALLKSERLREKIARSASVLGMYVAMFVLCGYYASLWLPSLIHDSRQLATLLILVILTIGVSVLLATSIEGWQAEVVPLVLFGMIAAVVYSQTLALLLSACVVIVFVVGQGFGGYGHRLADVLLLLATTSGAILSLGNIRSRSKLLLVGSIAALVGFFTAIGVGAISGDPIFPNAVLQGGRLALWAEIAGSLMTCILPFVEKVFQIQTDISLIELGDPAHPLLQELIRRAPGTYNHSITVASLAESAADSIGARGLLVRVGAYFHDIGKMLKPGYFIENQVKGDNRHESLVPAMSTLVIIAHVKDGADLARQHRLPNSIIDFIQQHHGTTLVEFFYRRASEQHDNEQGDGVDESSFRYPGPKPQSKEAAVLMLADAVESASRVLVEPTPSRIENLVEEIAMKRLLDGQFDECDLTLAEVHTVQDSLVKSLTAVYHGRVKYPEAGAG